MNTLMTFCVGALLVGGIASCKSKTNGSENQHADHNMNNMPGMDMSKMKGEDMQKRGKDSTPAAKLEIKVDDLIKPVNQNIISQVATFRPQKTIQELMVTAKGKIGYDERRFTNIASRVSGRIESTSVKFQFQPIKKGQLLFTIYSPELVNAQQDLLFLSSDSLDKGLLNTAREKLLLFGLSTGQISEIQRSKKVITTIAIYAPVNGYVIANEAQTNAASTVNTSREMGVGMMSSSSTASPEKISSSSQPILRQGQYVSKGQTVFKVVNTEVVWALLKIFPDDVAKISTGDKARINIEGNESKTVPAKIDFVEKYFNAEDKTVTARVYLDNEGVRYKIGDLVSAIISAGDKEALWVPREAVLDVGNSHVVFVKQGNSFRAKEVQTGLHNGKNIELISGISQGVEIASNAQYLVDSEAFIKTE